ncbi:YopX family protein [Lacticaseibacillus paracasei]|uniref:YopX family protein n=1 Tax=Lacticaseibacillus paracasei TaxID=1597 RepID=UPI0023A98934|nr:YopX family protein [Lacticaseibacillus paracasei]MDE5158222.1 YopX family protein [Lacticaseibacillus paracasei]
MKQEFKFRRWTGEEMVAVHKITFDDDELIVYGGGVVHFADSSTVMQYTGLKDKKGREIYEGDILKTDSEINYVDFQDFGFCTHNKQPLVNYVFNTINDKLKYVDDTFEVIGNIFENPELL